MLSLGKRWKLITVYIYALIFSFSGFAVAEPIHDAAKEGDLAKVKILIAEGSGVNVRDENGLTPLHIAAYQGYEEVAELLIFKGANVNAADKMGAIENVGKTGNSILYSTANKSAFQLP